ncbi:MAG: OmpA family protein [Flavobacteriaceae bacterium]
MIKKGLFLALSVALFSSCVSKKIYSDLEKKYNDLKDEKSLVDSENADLSQQKNQLELDKNALQTELERLKAEYTKLDSECNSVKNNLKNLQGAYAALEKDSNASIQANSEKNRELLAQLEAKEKALQAEQERLEKLKQDLQKRSDRINELESLIAANENNLKALRDKLSKALYSFEGKGLTVEQRDGKVYVSMENKLLFASGSWVVGAEGKSAVVEVGKILAENPDISVLIEGHTDNVPYNGQGQVQDNWDLSTKRATSIVRILKENKDINPLSLTAAGRSEYAPVAPNETSEGKSKNRRIEIILTPKLDEISKMLNDI